VPPGLGDGESGLATGGGVREPAVGQVDTRHRTGSAASAGMPRRAWLSTARRMHSASASWRRSMRLAARASIGWAWRASGETAPP
jgi:hypothetical protein